LLLTWWLTAALAARSVVPDATWVPTDRAAAVCASSVPSAKRMRGKDAQQLAAMLAELPEVDDVAGWYAGHAATVEGWKEHPARDALMATIRVLLADGDDALALAGAYPRDPCVQATGALVAFERGQYDEARGMLGRAWIATRHPEVALLLARVVLAEGKPDRAAEVVDKGLRSDGEHLALRKLRAQLAAERGEAVSVFEDLVALRMAGDHELDGYLMAELLRQGDLDGYLRIAAEQATPIAALEGLATDASPRATLRDRLGLEGPTASIEAILHTSMGDVSCTLFPDRAPVTVANFVGLATGSQPWVHPDTGLKGEGALYAGTRFHRVIPDFMIQGGDPKGTGQGDGGYEFHDEIAPDLRFDRRGRLAMANAGPATNGTQFFVTAAPTPHLDGRHTIFGQCRDIDVVDAITAVSRDGRDKPFQDVTLDAVEIVVR
jgi:peptidyl-prolyl cis-trans isomerase A (cyclophilin A)